MKLSQVSTSVPCDRCLAPTGLFLSTFRVMTAITVAPTGALLAFKASLSKGDCLYACLWGILQAVVDAVADALASEKKTRQRSERAGRERLAAREHQRWEDLIDEIVDEDRCDLDDVPAGVLDWAMA